MLPGAPRAPTPAAQTQGARPESKRSAWGLCPRPSDGPALLPLFPFRMFYTERYCFMLRKSFSKDGNFSLCRISRRVLDPSSLSDGPQPNLGCQALPEPPPSSDECACQLCCLPTHTPTTHTHPFIPSMHPSTRPSSVHPFILLIHSSIYHPLIHPPTYPSTH